MDEVMKTNRVIKFGLVPFLLIVFCLIFIFKSDLQGQQAKKKNQPNVKIKVQHEYDRNGNLKSYDSTYSFTWSNEGNENMDSLVRSLNKNFGFSPFGLNGPFKMPYGINPNIPSGHAYRNLNPNDSLYGYINPKDSVYYFDNPNLFDDPFFEEFFDDPFFRGKMSSSKGSKQDFFDPSDSISNYVFPFNIRSMIEEHRRMMEDMRKFFDSSMPDFPESQDSLSPVPQKHVKPLPLSNRPKGQEI